MRFLLCTMKESNVVIIPVPKYWEIINNICDTNPEEEWFKIAESELEEKFLGLYYIKNDTYKSHFSEMQLSKFFRVINKEKYLWAKLKYGI